MTQDHQLREALETFTGRVRRDLDAHIQALSADVARISAETQEFWREMIERAVADARQEAERNGRLQVELARNEVTRDMEMQLARERSALQTATIAATEAAAAAALRPMEVGSAREARIATLERLLGAVRRIDAAQSLTQILDTLLRASAAETTRVAIMLVDGDCLRPWAATGFSVDIEPREIVITQSGIITASVALKQTSFVKSEVREGNLPAFMQVPVGHTGLIVPLVVGDDAVAVLYADDIGRKHEQEDAPVWTEEIDLLVRHAAIRLENITSVRTAEALGS